MLYRTFSYISLHILASLSTLTPSVKQKVSTKTTKPGQTVRKVSEKILTPKVDPKPTKKVRDVTPRKRDDVKNEIDRAESNKVLSK